MFSKRYTAGVLCVLALALFASNPNAVWAKGPPPGKGPGGGGDDGGGDTTVDHKARQSGAIQLGTSGGSISDLANGYCCSGTLGSLVQDSSGVQYILSNTHVLAGDSVTGGNGKVSQPGDAINQPGYIDVQCQDIPNDYVAQLTEWIDLPHGGTGTVDAAIAEVLPGMVDSSGAILGIGTISSTPLDAVLDQQVKKSGRTSALTTGKVAGLNATITVGYSDECAGDSYTTRFTGQIIVTPGKFLKGGDSGSLMVENTGNNPQPIGLLFAGSKRIAVASPIQDVLDELTIQLGKQVSMVGTATSSSSSSTSTSSSTPGNGNANGNGIARATQAKERNEARLLAVPGSVGHAVGKGRGGQTVVKVLVREITPQNRASAPSEVDGVAVELMEVGDIVAY